MDLSISSFIIEKAILKDGSEDLFIYFKDNNLFLKMVLNISSFISKKTILTEIWIWVSLHLSQRRQSFPKNDWVSLHLSQRRQSLKIAPSISAFISKTIIFTSGWIWISFHLSQRKQSLPKNASEYLYIYLKEVNCYLRMDLSSSSFISKKAIFT